MTLEDEKRYLTTRISSEDFLSLTDAKLSGYFVTSQNLLQTYYDFADVDDAIKIPIVAQEMLFLYNSNIDLNLFYQYEGLTSFNIGGAIQGSVDLSKSGDMFSKYVRALLNAAEIEAKIDDPDSKVKTSFTWT